MTCHLNALGQVIPLASRTNLDHITGQFRAALCQLFNLNSRSDIVARRAQAISEDISNKYDFGVFADRAKLASRVTDPLGGPQELGMGIAYIEHRQPAVAVIANDRITDKAIVNLSAATGVEPRALEHGSIEMHCAEG